MIAGRPTMWAVPRRRTSASSARLDAWRDAALHLLTYGLLPPIPLDVRRALWKRGGADQLLVEKLDRLYGGDDE